MAPRHPVRAWRGRARGAGLAVGIWLALAGMASACADAPVETAAMPGSIVSVDTRAGVTTAWYEAPTTRYPHGVLGDTTEAGALAVRTTAGDTCRTARIILPQDEVFEDLAPRLADVDGDGTVEVVTVQSNARLGARLALFGLSPDGTQLSLYAATPNIGRRNRWLAPIGIADLDGDGAIEIAYIDRPHLARTLRVWRVADGALTQVAALEGLTNHRIGEDFISSGLRDCGTGPEILTADAAWSRLMSTRLTQGGHLETRSLGPWSQAALADALACRD